MDTQAIIEDYVNNVAANLPRSLRDDVGFELRTLLTEQLSAAAQEAGRPPDTQMAMDLLHRFGPPHDVASRYVSRGFPLVAPEYSGLFTKVAALCVALQWTITFPAVLSSRMTVGDWWLRWGFSAFTWVGVLLVWFAMASWVQRRFPADANGRRPWTHWIFWVPFAGEWRPGEPEGAEWRAGMHAAPLGAALTIFFIAPAWILGHLLPAGTDVSWALYDGHFRRWLLTPLLALMAVRLALLVAAALDAGRRTRTERLRFALCVAFVVLSSWAAFSGPVFAHVLTDTLFKAWLLVFLLVNAIQILVWIRRATTRVHVPKTLLPQS
jgi:hypothetical protein